jgi:hypothetical protein
VLRSESFLIKGTHEINPKGLSYKVTQGFSLDSRRVDSRERAERDRYFGGCARV